MNSNVLVLISLLSLLALAAVLAVPAAAEDDCGGNCQWQELGTLNMNKNYQSIIGNYVFAAYDYDGRGSVVISYYNTSSPNAINETIVTEGEYAESEDGNLRFYGVQITNMSNIENGTDVYGVWPCCPKAEITAWQKTWITPTETPPSTNPASLTFSVSASAGASNDTFLVGENIPYTIGIHAGDSYMKNLTISLDTAGLPLLQGERKIFYAEIYAGNSEEQDGTFMAYAAGQLNPGIEWSYIDENNNIIRGTANAAVTIQPPVTVRKYYDDNVCTGKNTTFSIGVANLQTTASVDVTINDSLPDGFISSGFLALQKEYHVEIPPGEVNTIQYIAEPKTTGVVQVPDAEAVWKLGSSEGTMDISGGTMKVYGPMIVVSKNAVIKDRGNISGNETISVTVNIFNRGDTAAYVKVTDVLPNASGMNVIGSDAYNGYIAAGGAGNASYEFHWNPQDGTGLNLSRIMDTAPQIEVYVSKLDSMYPEKGHAYSSAYVFEKKISTVPYSVTGLLNQGQTNQNRNPPIVFNNIYASSVNVPNQHQSMQSSQQRQSQPQSSPSSLLEKISLFLKGLFNRI